MEQETIQSYPLQWPAGISGLARRLRAACSTAANTTNFPQHVLSESAPVLV